MALIGLLSDVHASPEPVAQALHIFAAAGVDQIFCAGDIAGYQQHLPETISLLEKNRVQCILGNHDLNYLEQNKQQAVCHEWDFLSRLPVSIETQIEGRKIYMVHAQPPHSLHGGIKLLDKTGKLVDTQVQYWREKLRPYAYDVLIVGHSHQVYAIDMGDTLLINPGSSAFNHSCAILRLPEMTVEFFALSGCNIEVTWNWGEYIIHGKHT